MFTFTDLTIVVPTSIVNIKKTWVNQINNYISNGLRVVICIPPDYEEENIYDKGILDGAFVVVSDIKGQVNQRYYAYRFCSTPLILHMDDDIYIDLADIGILLDQYQMLPINSCIAPRLYSSFPVKTTNKIVRIVKNIIYYSQFHDPSPGSVSKSSFPIPINQISLTYSQKPVLVDWLPGGILLLRRSDIINYRYYKYKGKAYCEDLIHSFLLNQNGIKLYLYPQITYSTSVDNYVNLTTIEFISFILNDMKARNYYRKLCFKPFFPFFLAYLGIITNYLFCKVFIKLIKRLNYNP